MSQRRLTHPGTFNSDGFLPTGGSMTSYPPARRRRDPRLVRGLLVGLGVLALWFIVPAARNYKGASIPCRDLPGASDTVVIMKTGVTSIEERLPSQLEFPLKCVPNYLVFSDHEELFRGKYQVRDVLANISPDIVQTSPDFELYRHVKEVGREGLRPEDITGVRTTDKTTDEEKILVPGWVLDKWKFLPMMNETFVVYPDKKWYVFVESDTYLFWSTVLKYVSTLDHRKPHVLGHRTTRLTDHRFMQGGSGYVLSHAALQTLVQHIRAHARSLDLWMEDEWAGDISLGTIMNKVEIPLTYAWPIFQPAFFGVTYFGVEFEGDRRYWCFPAATYHHMTPETIEDTWHMEQEWLQEENDHGNPYKFIRQKDVFNNLMLPRMRIPRPDWDNYCDQLRPDATTLSDCKETCINDEACLQFQFEPQLSRCKIAFVPLYGEANLGSGLYSEWLFDRIERWRDDQPVCDTGSFLYYGDIDLDL